MVALGPKLSPFYCESFYPVHHQSCIMNFVMPSDLDSHPAEVNASPENMEHGIGLGNGSIQNPLNKPPKTKVCLFGYPPLSGFPL